MFSSFVSTFVFFTVIVHAGGDLITAAVGSDVQLFNGTCGTGENWEVFHVSTEVSLHRITSGRDATSRPEPQYAGRLNGSDPLLLAGVRMNDVGLYELICGGDTKRVELQILPHVEVWSRAGRPAALPCYFVTAGDAAQSVTWVKSGGEDVLEVNRAARGRAQGARFSGSRVSLREHWMEEGDLSLVVEAAGETHRGEYFCLVTAHSTRSLAAVVRLRVSPGVEPATTLATKQELTDAHGCAWAYWVTPILGILVVFLTVYVFRPLWRKRVRDFKKPPKSKPSQPSRC